MFETPVATQGNIGSPIPAAKQQNRLSDQIRQATFNPIPRQSTMFVPQHNQLHNQDQRQVRLARENHNSDQIDMRLGRQQDINMRSNLNSEFIQAEPRSTSSGPCFRQQDEQGTGTPVRQIPQDCATESPRHTVFPGIPCWTTLICSTRPLQWYRTRSLLAIQLTGQDSRSMVQATSDL